MYPYWQCHLFRAANLIIEISAGRSYWSSEIHEPLILALFFPYVRCKPWELKRSSKLVEVERVLRGMLKADRALRDLFCSNFASSRQGFRICRRSWCGSCYKTHQALPFQIARPENDEGHKWRKKADQVRFTCARTGDMLSAPFQCDICWFVNIQKREPVASQESNG